MPSPANKLPAVKYGCISIKVVVSGAKLALSRSAAGRSFFHSGLCSQQCAAGLDLT